MNETEIPIPKRLKTRPKFRGMPIPFTTFINPTTKQPDFKVTDERSWRVCAEYNQCGICGQKLLPHEFYFIGGEKSCTSGIFFDPPMHKECAEYSFKVCPFLACVKGYSKAPVKQGDTFTISVDSNMSKERPAKMGILFCKSYHLSAVEGGGHLYFVVDKIESVEWKD